MGEKISRMTSLLELSRTFSLTILSSLKSRFSGKRFLANSNIELDGFFETSRDSLGLLCTLINIHRRLLSSVTPFANTLFEGAVGELSSVVLVGRPVEYDPTSSNRIDPPKPLRKLIPRLALVLFLKDLRFVQVTWNLMLESTINGIAVLRPFLLTAVSIVSGALEF
jgi:hypothetical protein